MDEISIHLGINGLHCSADERGSAADTTFSEENSCSRGIVNDGIILVEVVESSVVTRAVGCCRLSNGLVEGSVVVAGRCRNCGQ